MAAAFNLTAQLNLQGPTNIGAIVTSIKKQLGNISANVNVNVSPGTSQNIAALNAAFASFNATLATTATNSNNAANAIRGLTTAIGQANNPLNNLQQNMTNNATAAAQLTQNLQNLNRVQNRCANDMEELGRQAAGTIRRFAAFGVVTGIMYKVGNSINSASKEFLDFNKELVRVAQVTDTSLSNLSSLTKQISQLSTTFGVASSDLIKVSSTLAQAGLSAKDTEKALKALALSALAPSFDSLNDTVEGSIALMRQFGIGAGELEGALGSVNAVAAKFAVEASDIITAIQRTGGVFATASKGVATGTEALNQFISVFTSIRATTRESAETIATGLRTIFTRIQRGPTIDALKEYGVVLTDLQGKFVGPYEAVKRLSEGLSKLDPRDLRFGQIVEELGGFRQIGKVIPLIQQFAVAQQALKVAQQGQASLAYDAATAQESVANKMTKVREEFVALIRSIGESTSFQTFVKLSLDLTSQLIKLADAAKGVLPALAAIAVARGAGNAVSFGRGFIGGLRRNQGGPIGFASGGFVPGQGDRDTVPAMLTPGEFVIRKKAVKAIGAGRLAGINKYAGGGIVDDLDKGVGAAILEYKPGFESNTFKVKVGKQEKSVTETRQGLNEKTYSSFDNALSEGIRRGVNYATRIVSKDLGIPAKRVDKGEEQTRFLAGINDATRGNLFEDILRTMRKDSDAFSLMDDPQKPFDFPNGLSGTLKDNYNQLPAKWVDAKSSFDAAKGKGSIGLKFKTQRQIDIDTGIDKTRARGMGKPQASALSMEELKKQLKEKGHWGAGPITGNNLQMAQLKAKDLIAAGLLTQTRRSSYNLVERNLGGPIQKFAKGGAAKFSKEQQKDALLLYQAGSGPFTKALAGNKSTFSDRGEKYKTKDIKEKLLSTSTFDLPKLLFSGLGPSQIKEIIKDTQVSAESLSRDAKKIFPSMVGKTIDFPVFLSTSPKNSIAKSFVGDPGGMLSINASKSTTKGIDVLKAKEKKGFNPNNTLPGLDKIDKNKINAYDKEDEYILPPNTRFKINSISGSVSEFFAEDLNSSKKKSGGGNDIDPWLMDELMSEYNFVKTKLNIKTQLYAQGGSVDSMGGGLLSSILKSSPLTYSPTTTISKLLKTENSENALKSIEAAYGIKTAKLIGSGAESAVFDIGKRILKISQGNLDLPRKTSGVAGYYGIKKFGQLTAALQQKLSAEAPAKSEDINLLKKKLAKQGLNWEDAHEFNVGYNKKGIPKILDGKISKFAKGGSAEDTVPALLTPGEFVINKKAASRIGLSTLHKMNHADKIPGFNKGGVVQGFAGGGLIGGGLKLASFALRKGLSGIQRFRGSSGVGLSGGAAQAAGGGGGIFDLMGLLGGQAALSYAAGENPESTARGRGIQDIGGGVLTSSTIGAEAGRMLGGNRGALIGRLAGGAYGAYTGYGQTEKTKQAYDERIQQEIIDARGEESSKGVSAYIKGGKSEDRKIAMLQFQRLQEEEAKGSSQLTKKQGESTEAFTKRLQKTQEQGANQAKDLLFAEMKKTGKTFSEVSRSMNPQELDMLTQNIAETDSEYIQLQQQRNRDVAGLRASGANKAADDLQKTYNAKLSSLANTIAKRESAEIDSATQADRLAKEAKKLHDAMRRASMSIESTFSAIGQALEKTAFNMDQASSRGEEIMSGKISGANPFERNVNILKNPTAYSAAERQAASSNNGLLGGQTKLVNDIAKLSESKSRAIGVGITSEKKAGATKDSVAEDVVRQLTRDVEATFGANSTASKVYIDAIEKQKEVALKAAEGSQEFDIESFVESVSGPLSSASKQAGELQIQSQQLLARAFKELSKVGEELSSIQQKQIDRGQQLIAMQYANNAAMKESLGIRSTLAGRTNERSALAANRLGFKNSNITSKDILNRYSGLQQGRSVAEADKLKLGNALGPNQQISQQFLSASRTLANFNAEIKNIEQEIGNLPKVLQDNLDDVFGEMKKRTALLESSKQAGGDFAARLVTSTPQELRELSSTFNVMNNAINGNVTSIQQSQSAQKAYYTALMSGKTAQEAMTDAQQAFATQNRDALSLFKDLADVAGVEGPDIDAMKANMLESFARSQGMENFQPLQMMIAKLRENPAQRAQNDPILQALQGQAQTLMQAQVEAVNLANEIDRQQQARLLMEVGDKIIAELQAAPIQIQVAVQNMSAMTGGLQAPQTKSRGGIIYASKGSYVNFQPKGTDTVPAMLTPGEFVVNARSTAKNLPLLKSINKADGGTVSRSGKFQTVSGSKANIDFRGRMSHLSNGGKVAYLAKGGFGIDWDTFAPGVNDPAAPKAKKNQFIVNPNASGAEDLITNTNQTASKAKKSKKTGWFNWGASSTTKPKPTALSVPNKDELLKKAKDAYQSGDQTAAKMFLKEAGESASSWNKILATWRNTTKSAARFVAENKSVRISLGTAAGTAASFALDPLARMAVGAAGGGEEAQNITGNLVQGASTVAGGLGSVAIGAAIEASQNLTSEQRQAKYERERTANDTILGAFSETFANPLGGILRLNRSAAQLTEAGISAANLESETRAKSKPEYQAAIRLQVAEEDRAREKRDRIMAQNKTELDKEFGPITTSSNNMRLANFSVDNRAKPSPAQLEKEAKIKAGWTWDEFDQVWVPPVKSKPAGVKAPPAVLAKQKRGEALAFGRAGQAGFSAVTGTIGGGGSRPASTSNPILPQAGLNKGMTNASANPQLAGMFFGSGMMNNAYRNLSPIREAFLRGVPLSQVQNERKNISKQRGQMADQKRNFLASRRKNMSDRNALLYKASGGSIVPYAPKGTDTVPAMLSPGEFVVNRDSTQKNLGLLKSINSSRGGQVNYLAKGGTAGGSSTGVLSGIDSLVGGFDQFVQQLKEALPTAVNVQGRHDVNVVINGASILQNVLEGPLGNMVKTAINEAFSKRSQQNEGSTA